MLEEDLGAALGSRLHQEMADVTAAPGLATAVRRRRTRQRWATGTALAVPVLAGGVALALVAGGSPARHGTPPVAAHPGAATTPAADPRLRDVAYVSQQSQQALGTIDQYVVHETYTADGQPKGQDWADGQGSRWLSVREPVSDPPFATLNTIEGGKSTFLIVDYRAHTWFRSELPATSDIKGLGIAFGDTDALRTDLKNGLYVIVGQEQVDGRDAVHLRYNPPPGEPAHAQLWVDPQSFLPLKWIGDKGVPVATTFEWLPRTPENLARIALPVPAGFTEQASPPNPAATPTPKR
jgi:hypothetical protein